MTRGPVRWQREGDLHFITASCWHRLPYLHDGYALAEEELERTRVRYDLDVVGYVFMPEHMHLLMSEPGSDLLSGAIKLMKLSVSLRQPIRPFWQKRYYDANLCSHSQMVDCLRYIHRNPVKRGLVQNPEDWPWSSYRCYLTGEFGRVQIDSDWARAKVNCQPPCRHPFRTTYPNGRCEWLGR